MNGILLLTFNFDKLKKQLICEVLEAPKQHTIPECCNHKQYETLHYQDTLNKSLYLCICKEITR